MTGETFECPLCHEKLSVIYRDLLPSGLAVCCFCREDESVVDPFRGIRDPEVRLWQLRVEGYAVKEVARILGISERTVVTRSREIAERIRAGEGG